jgi:hypothetical protein
MHVKIHGTVGTACKIRGLYALIIFIDRHSYGFNLLYLIILLSFFPANISVNAGTLLSGTQAPVRSSDRVHSRAPESELQVDRMLAHTLFLISTSVDVSCLSAQID